MVSLGRMASPMFVEEKHVVCAAEQIFHVLTSDQTKPEIGPALDVNSIKPISLFVQ